ncbi:N-terminal cleavage protein [Opitutaceae bacterium TAV5]|nr:N-terminal cleavage protein [Opitutaceae bacterium TAV5]
MHSTSPRYHRLKTRCRHRPHRHAFTLIELLTVIAIIGILAAIIIPTVGKVRETARKAQCASNLRQVGMAIMAYAGDNKDRLPGPLWVGMHAFCGNNNDTALLGNAIAPYVSQALPENPAEKRLMPVLTCPAWLAATTDKEGKCYTMVSDASDLLHDGTTRPPFGVKNSAHNPRRITEFVSPSTAAAMIERDKPADSGVTKPVHGNIRNQLYLDAHVKAVAVQ